MTYLGDFATGATVIVPWNATGADGSSITRATNGNIRVYKDSSTTQRSSSAGITDSEDFDALTGLNHIAIDLSDNTDAGFYAAGHDYFVVLEGAVIDGITINAALASFSIENRFHGRIGIQKNTVFSAFQFKMVDASGVGVTGLVDANFTEKAYSIGGGANGTLSGTISEDAGGDGFYTIDLDDSEVDGDCVTLNFQATGTALTSLTIITSR